MAVFHQNQTIEKFHTQNILRCKATSNASKSGKMSADIAKEKSTDCRTTAARHCAMQRARERFVMCVAS
jgi:hypothetical protein